MRRSPPAPPRAPAALVWAAAAALSGTGCLGHAGPVALAPVAALPLPAAPFEEPGAPIVIEAREVELIVSGGSLERDAQEDARRAVAEELARALGAPGAQAVPVSTRLFVTPWQAPLVVTGPYKRLGLALETELPGGHSVRTALPPLQLDDDSLFALEHWVFAAAAGQGLLALGLAGAGVALAGNSPQKAAGNVALSAVPAAGAAGVTALLGVLLRGHAQDHEQTRAAEALSALVHAHAAELRAELRRRSSAPVALPARGESAVTVRLADEAACLSQADLERDLEALVPATSSRRWWLDVSVQRAPRDELDLALRLTPVAASTPLAERQLHAGRADCATLPRAIARIVKKQLEAEASAPSPGSAP